METIKLHADVRALKRAAPSWAKWFVVCSDGQADWQASRGDWRNWVPYGTDMAYFGIFGTKFGAFAIDLTTGSVHLQSDDGKITVVPQPVWVAARKRKGRAR